jgi:outer membrane lipoprotein-sorting protein
MMFQARSWRPLTVLLSVALLVIGLAARPTLADSSLTPEGLFLKMEERADRIFSLEAELDLASGADGTFVVLSLQNPDLFSLDFARNQLRVVFDGETLWIFIESLGEVIYLDAAGSGGWLTDPLREWINPKRIITRMTRHTLFSFFEVHMLPSHTAAASTSEPLAPPRVASAAARVVEPAVVPPTARLRFTPKGGTIYRRLFDVGFYEMTFDLSTFLPIGVDEYSPAGELRGSLAVTRYRINERLPRERFRFVAPAGAKLVPMAVVFAQKLEQGKELLVERMEAWFQRVKRTLTEW